MPAGAGELAARRRELLGGAHPTASCSPHMEDAGELVLEDDATAVWAYRPETAALEAELAGASCARSPAPRRVLDAPSELLDGDLVPAPEQAAAVRAAFALAAVDRHRRPGHRQDGDDPDDLRGGRGAGRRRSRWSRRPAAPRGGWPSRPACDASTIHSALGWVPGHGPTVDELDADLLVVDETSMANLELLVTLLRAVGPRTHVVLVGDADQLAPVGAGKPFAELVGERARAGRRAHAHLPPGRGQHDRARRARGPPRRRRRRSTPARTSRATCS